MASDLERRYLEVSADYQKVYAIPALLSALLVHSLVYMIQVAMALLRTLEGSQTA